MYGINVCDPEALKQSETHEWVNVMRNADIGGGLVRASLLHALLDHLHLDVRFFKSSPVYKEAGMAIGVARNVLDALDLMGLSASQCLQQAGAAHLAGDPVYASPRRGRRQHDRGSA